MSRQSILHLSPSLSPSAHTVTAENIPLTDTVLTKSARSSYTIVDREGRPFGYLHGVISYNSNNFQLLQRIGYRSIILVSITCHMDITTYLCKNRIHAITASSIGLQYE